VSQLRVEAGVTAAVVHCIGKSRERCELEPQAKLHNCYDAGRGGWWLQRWLIEQKLLPMLLRHHRGERVWSVVRELTAAGEDARRSTANSPG